MSIPTKTGLTEALMIPLEYRLLMCTRESSHQLKPSIVMNIAAFAEPSAE